MHYYEIIHIKNLLNYLRLRFISDFYSGNIDFLKIVNFLKNLDLPREELNKIGFIHHYKIIYTKKLLGYLWLWLISTILILGV